MGLTIVNRLGKKSKLAHKISVLMPKHDTYIEPFFGSGGMFFNKQVAKYNFLNDLDSEICNLFECYTQRYEELYEAFSLMPVSETLWEKYKNECPICPIWRAVRFLFQSNFGFLGKPDTMLVEKSNRKELTLKNMLAVRNFLKRNDIYAPTKLDFEKFLNSIHFRKMSEKQTAFIYADPPYLGTNDNYSNSFTTEDHERLQRCLIDFGAKFMISEFNNPAVLEIAKSNGLLVTEIGDRVNIGNRRTEIIIHNYEITKTLF